MLTRVFGLVLAMIMACGSLVPLEAVRAATEPTLRITELLPDPAAPLTDASDEFIELYNAGSTDITTAGYVVKSGDNLTVKHTLPTVTVPAQTYVVLKSAETHISLANDGSSVALFAADQSPVGSSITYKTAPAGSAWALHEDGTWSWTTTPTPAAANRFTAAPTPPPGQGAGPATTSPTSAPTSEPAAASDYSALMLTELFPDPAAPLTDADDEFIELYNASDAPVDVAGLVVKTGASLATKHTLKAQIIAPYAYAKFMSADTKIALANAGSSAAIFTPAGAQIGATITYPKAISGSAWAYDGSVWAWTSTPTPGSANVMTAAPSSSASTSSKASSSTSSSAASKTTKTTKATATKAPTASKAAAAVAKTATEAATSPGAKWLIFALLGLTIAYCLYEFRYDLQRIYLKLRRNPAAGGRLGKPTAGR